MTKTEVKIFISLLILALTNNLITIAQVEMPEFSLKYMNSEYTSPVLIGRKKYFDSQREMQKDILFFNALNNCMKYQYQSQKYNNTNRVDSKQEIINFKKDNTF